MREILYRMAAGLAVLLVLAGCGSDGISGPQSDDDPPVKRDVGVLEAVLEADSTLGPPHYPTSLRAVCTTNGGQATITSAVLVGPFADSEGFRMEDTDRGEVGDTLSIVVSRPGQALLTCQSSVGHTERAAISFDGFKPEADLYAVSGTEIFVFEEATIDLSDHIQWADSVFFEPMRLPPPSVEARIEHDASTGRTLIHVRPTEGPGNTTLHIQVENGFGTVKDGFTFRAVYPPGLSVRAEDWIDSRTDVPARVTFLDAAGHSMRGADFEDDDEPLFFEHRSFPAPISRVAAEPVSGEYFPRDVPFTQRPDEFQYLSIPLLPKAPCRSLFAGDPDPLASCLDMTSRLMFSPLYPEDPLEGFHQDTINRAFFLIVHQETGSTIPGEWVAAVRAAADVWEQAGVYMEYPLVTHAIGVNADVGRVVTDALGRWVAASPGIVLYVADTRPGARVELNFLTNEEEVRSVVVLLPVNDPPSQWQEELELARIRSEYALADDPEFFSWDRGRQARFLAEWGSRLSENWRTNLEIPPGSLLDEVFPR